MELEFAMTNKSWLHMVDALLEGQDLEIHLRDIYPTRYNTGDGIPKWYIKQRDGGFMTHNKLHSIYTFHGKEEDVDWFKRYMKYRKIKIVYELR